MKLPNDFNICKAYPPLPYQKKAIGFSILKERAGLLLGLGLGKTYCAINSANYHIQKKKVSKVLIAAPPSILFNWYSEINKFSPHEATILHAYRDERIRLIRESRKSSSIKFDIINYEGLYPFLDHLQDTEYDMVIADESSRYISNHLTQRAKALITIGDGVSHKLILTGTLIASKPMGLWSQFRFLDDGESFGENFYAWRNYFFKKISLGKYNKWVLREDRKRILERRIFRKCIAINNRDVLKDLPPIRFQRVMMNMDKEFAADYRAVQNQIIAEVEADEEKAIVNAQHIFAKIVRLQQMTSGFVGDIDKNVKILKNKPKLELLMEYINEIVDSDESVIVWCRFRPSIKLISDELKKYKIKHSTMSGEDNTASKKYKKWKGFQEDNSIKVFVGQIAAGGIGIELFKIESDDEYQHMIFYENTFTLDHRTQAIGRSDGRIGQNSKVRVIDLIMKDTIDEKIIKSIEKDKEVADGIMKYGIRKFLESNEED